MIKIYHNPRCKKSRDGLAIVKESGKPYEIIKYLETPLTHKELTQIIDMMGIKPIELVRTEEKIWKETFKNKTLTDTEIIGAMVKNPKLIERPIVIVRKKAVIGRPKERIEALLS